MKQENKTSIRCSSKLLLFIILLMALPSLNAQQKIKLDAAMFYNFSTKGDAGLWVDEQALANDPAAGNGGQPTTVFSPGWVNADIYYPAYVVLDLGRTYSLSSLWLFDTNDSDSLFIYTGDPSSWGNKKSIFLNTYNTWREVSLQQTTRFLRFEIVGPSTRVAEIVLYGTPVGAPAPLPIANPLPKPFMRDFFGVNGFVNDPYDKLSCVGNLREYHNWGWDEGNLDTTYPGYPNNQYAWNPSWVSGPGWGFYFDDFYTDLRSNGITVSPDLQGAAHYITGFVDSLLQHKPLSAGENPLLASSYIEHADYMFQFAARYGKTAVPVGQLKLKSDQQPKTGTSLVRYLENWNEPDKWWFTRGGYFRPDEFATFCSADYDGHEGALGPGKGMKTADPNIKMVMAGLASLNLEYVRCMKLWSDFNRTKGFPADVLNFHHYSENGSHGISPEADSLKLKLSRLVQYRDKYLPGKEIWLSEFGYDTQPESVQAAVAIDTNDIYEVQGQWILRSFLEAAASGIDKAFLFMLRDANALDPNKYNSCGLTNELWYGHQPKKSWFYVNTMNQQLRNTRFEREVNSGNPTVSVYQFNSQNADTTVYAVWCRTSSNAIINNFELNVGAAIQVKMTLPVNQKPNGNASNLTVQSGKVSCRVTERPVFIQVINPSKSSLRGQLRFFNESGSALPEAAQNFCIQLFNASNEAVSMVVNPLIENNLPVYNFENVSPNQQLKIRLWEESNDGLLGNTWLWNNWSGITAADALILNYLTVLSPVVQQLAWMSDVNQLSPFLFRVADVNNSSGLSAVDALILVMRSVGIQSVNPFPGGRHNFCLAGNFDPELQAHVFPNSPEFIFDEQGIFAANSPDETVFYEAHLPLLSPGDHVFNVYFVATGNVNLSVGL
ncbi:MAG: hypothetical protein IT219_05115 [Bacteroidales bacterium]|nr:hypothetical protein [Bacteroidales bacterium]